MTDSYDLDAVWEEVESRLRSNLKEEGQDPDADSDHSMYLRQDIYNEVLAELRTKEGILNDYYRQITTHAKM